MSFAADITIGLKSLFGNNPFANDIADIETLPPELNKSIKDISDRAFAAQKRIAGGIKLSASDRIITAPNIPIVGSIVAAFKKHKIDKQLKAKIKEKNAEVSNILEKDSVVKAATDTNPYTNPEGKSVVRTQGAQKLENTPREQGGEDRTRFGH